MATYIAFTAAATTPTLPAGTTTGDWVVVFAGRDANATPPTLPAGWTQIITRAAANAILVAYREKDATWSTIPSFVNATRATAVTVRPTSGKTLAVGINAVQGATSAAVAWAVQTMHDATGASVILRYFAHTRPDASWTTPANHTLIEANGTRPGFGMYRKTVTTDMAAGSCTVSRSDVWSSAQVEIKEIIPIAVTQAAYGFYADGTESGSTSLVAQDTAPTIDVTYGDGFAHLRLLLQSTTATASVNETWRLQYEKNASGSWTSVANSGAVVATFVGGAASPTTNRLTGGTGSFVAGSVAAGPPASISNVIITGNNYTELLWMLQLKQADLVQGDTLRFRLHRNAATTGMTYSSTPTINLTRIPPNAGAATTSWTATVSATGTKPPDPPNTGTAAVSHDWTITATGEMPSEGGDPVSAPTLEGQGGDWVTRGWGAQGWMLMDHQVPSGASISLPSGVSVSPGGAQQYTWVPSTTHSSAMRYPNGIDAGQFCWYAGTGSMDIQITFAQAWNGRMRAYFLSCQPDLRSENAVTLLNSVEQNTILLDMFDPNSWFGSGESEITHLPGGRWVGWDLDMQAGDVLTLEVTPAGGPNIVISGLLWDGVSTVPSPSEGTLSATDGTDTLAAAGVPTAPTHTATLSATDGTDTFSAIETATPPTHTATLAQTDGRDTIAAAGQPTAPTFTATLVQTDGRDTIAASGPVTAPTFTATFAQTDGRDTIVATATAAAAVATVLAMATSAVAGGQWVDVPITPITVQPGETYQIVVHLPTGHYPVVGTLPSEVGVINGLISVYDYTSNPAQLATQTKAPGSGVSPVLTPTGVAASTLAPTDGCDLFAANALTIAPTFTSTLAIADGTDTLVATGNTTAPTFTATLIKTDGLDTIVTTVTAGAFATSSFALTDGTDTLVAVGNTTAPTFTATLIKTDGLDTIAAAGPVTAPTFTGTLNVVDGLDSIVTAVLTTAPTFTATLIKTDGTDLIVTAVSTTAPTFTSTLAQADGVDTLVAAVNTTAPTFTSTLVKTDGVDTIVTTASSLPPPNSSTLAVTDGQDTIVTLVSAGAVGASVMAVLDGTDTIVTSVNTTAPTFTSALIVTDGRDVLVASATITSSAALAVADGRDTVVASASFGPTATLALTDGRDTIVTTAFTGAPTYFATLAQTDGRDTIAAAAQPTVPTFTSTLVQTDGRDAFTAAPLTTAPTYTATLAQTDGRDTLAATATITSTATLAVTDGRDTIVAPATIRSTSTFSATDGTDLLVASAIAAAPTFTATMPVTDGRDVFTATPLLIPLVHSSLNTTDGRDLFFGAGTLTIFTEGQWNGMFFDAMQYGDKAVIDWLLVPS